MVQNHELLDPRSLPGYKKIGSKALVRDEEVGGVNYWHTVRRGVRKWGGTLLASSQKRGEKVGGTLLG